MPLTLEDKVKHLESQATALEMQLAHRSEETATYKAEYEKLNDELADTTKKLDEEKTKSFEVMRSMTRQYKGMQDDLLNKINERERLAEALKDELETLKALQKEQIAVKDSVIKQKDEDAEKFRLETEKLCGHFSNLLSVARLKIINYTKSNV